MIARSQTEHQSDAGSTKDTPYLALTGELWGVFSEYFWENWPRYNGTALYLDIDCIHSGIHCQSCAKDAYLHIISIHNM